MIHPEKKQTKLQKGKKGKPLQAQNIATMKKKTHLERVHKNERTEKGLSNSSDTKKPFKENA